MSWDERMNDVIEYIEQNLAGAIDWERAARIACQPLSSLQRTFSAVAEMPISEYARRRRMDMAAKDLVSGDARIIDIALTYGYDSPEAFARAFREIHGMSPSAARDRGREMRAQARISFEKTEKGDVIMGYDSDRSTVNLANFYVERMPALRLIGRRYTQADMDADHMFSSKWNQWFHSGWFDQLGALGCIEGFEHTVVMGFHAAEEMAWWICMFFPVGTQVPDGFSHIDLPEGVAAMSWLRGYREDGELFAMSSHDMCMRAMRDAGYAARVDFGGVPGRWSFERYHNRRFMQPDAQGKVMLDYGVYIVERPGMVFGEDSHAPKMGVAAAHGNSSTAEPVRGAHAAPAQDAPQSSTATDAPSAEALWPHAVLLDDIAPYNVGAEDNPLLCALATLALKTNGITENTQYHCRQFDIACNLCGSCGDMCGKTILGRHHLDRVHLLSTFVGDSFSWTPTTPPWELDIRSMDGIFMPNGEDRLDLAMRCAGISYELVDRTAGEGEILRRVSASIRAGRPALMKFDEGPEWCVITGFDEADGSLYGLDMRSNAHPMRGRAVAKDAYAQDGTFRCAKWHARMQRMIVVAGTCAPLGLDAWIARMTGRLEMLEREPWERLILDLLDAVTIDNARGVAEYINRTVGFVAEMRWHAAECFRGWLLGMATTDSQRDALRACGDRCMDTHDTCWKVWEQLGVGPHTDFRLPNLISQWMLETERRETLAELFGRMVDNDRAVWVSLRGLVSKQGS